MQATLILCSSVPEATAYARAAKERGEKVIASSSVKNDETAKEYDHWEWLPSVYEDNFLGALNDMIARHKISRIFCPHNIAHYSLLALKKDGKLNIPLIGAPPIFVQMDTTSRLLSDAQKAADFVRQISASCELSIIKIAALLRQTEFTFGESSETKLIAMAAALSESQSGDVIEIGSFWGKTAVALAMLARYYETGSVLCIDPWEAMEAVQKNSSSLMQTMPQMADWETVLSGFKLHAAAVAANGKFNYLRMPSVKAETLYRDNRIISSPDFGETKYTGKISLIHIDGNHDYESVKADYEAWRPHVMRGGWVVLDDYVWLHGDGPKRHGDFVIEAEKQNIARCFTAGKALFIQIRD